MQGWEAEIGGSAARAMAGKDLKSIVDKIVDLPTLPAVVNRIMTLIELMGRIRPDPPEQGV